MQFAPMELGKLYFYTATILNWKHLLKSEKYKQIVIDSLKYLVDKQKIAVYAYVIMPNHIHLIWEMLSKNGKEMPHASFFKFTGHSFLKALEANHPTVLTQFESSENSRKYHFWERNALPVWLYSREVLEQKLQYIHANPVAKNWNLAEDITSYRYSSAKFYYDDVDEFSILTHCGDRL